jgi:hypothetical protein
VSIPVGYVVDDVDARLHRSRGGRKRSKARAGRKAEGACYAVSQAIPSSSRSRPRLHDMARRKA